MRLQWTHNFSNSFVFNIEPSYLSLKSILLKRGHREAVSHLISTSSRRPTSRPFHNYDSQGADRDTKKSASHTSTMQVVIAHNLPLPMMTQKQIMYTRLITLGLESTIGQPPMLIRNFHLLFSSFEAPKGDWVSQEMMHKKPPSATRLHAFERKSDGLLLDRLATFLSDIYRRRHVAFVGTSWRTTMDFGHTYWRLSQRPRNFTCCLLPYMLIGIKWRLTPWYLSLSLSSYL